MPVPELRTLGVRPGGTGSAPGGAHGTGGSRWSSGARSASAQRLSTTQGKGAKRAAVAMRRALPARRRSHNRDGGEAYRGAEAPPKVFAFHSTLAEIELRRGDGAIAAINPHSDADELHRLLDGAQAARLIESARAHAAIYVYPLSIGRPDPRLAVDTGAGLTLLGFEPKLSQREEEDPISFTIRFLAEAAAQANGHAAGRAADSERLDRIAAFMNRPGPWNGGDVCEYVAEELRESGRRLLEW